VADYTDEPLPAVWHFVAEPPLTPLPQAGEGSFLVLLYFRRSTFYSPLPFMGEGLGEKVGLSDFQQMFAVMGKFSNGFADVV